MLFTLFYAQPAKAPAATKKPSNNDDWDDSPAPASKSSNNNGIYISIDFVI